MSGSQLAQSLGIVTIIWGGTTINVDPKSSTFMRGGYVSKTVVNGNQIAVAQELMPASVKASGTLNKGQSLDALAANQGKELQVKCDTGQVYTIAAAYYTKDPAVKGGAGNNVSFEWGGAPATESIS